MLSVWHAAQTNPPGALQQWQPATGAGQKRPPPGLNAAVQPAVKQARPTPAAALPGQALQYLATAQVGHSMLHEMQSLRSRSLLQVLGEILCHVSDCMW